MPIPREHGAWAILYAPLAIAVASAGQFQARILFFVLAVTALFLAHQPLSMLARMIGAEATASGRFDYWLRWLIIYLTVAVAAAAPLLLHYQLWHLLLLGGIACLVLLAHIVLAAKRAERTLPGELLGILGLTLTAPGASYVVEGQLDGRGFFIWALSVLFFTSGVFYVKMRVGSLGRKAVSRHLRLHCALYHLLLALMAAAWVWWEWISILAGLAFLLIVVRAFWGMTLQASALNLRRIGYTELALTGFFVAALALV